MTHFTPKTVDELSELVASRSDPLVIQGGGTKVDFGGDDLDVVSSAGLTGVHLYEPGALTLVVAAGTPLAEVQALLDKEGQQLAFEPSDMRGLLDTKGSPTIGGTVAANASGPRRIQAGACRDHLLGVTFVNGLGEIIKNGGRVMKNVTGYDLVKLMAGSFGTLGVLSEVSLKVLPRAEKTASVCIHGLEDAAAIKALSQALGSPFDVTGAAHLPTFAGKDALTLIRLEGFAASVEYRAKKLKELFAGCEVTIEEASETSATLWRDLRDVARFQGQTGDVWRISVKPTDGPRVASALDGMARGLFYDWGGGLVWARVPEGSNVRGALAGIAGHARLERGNRNTNPMFPPEPEAVSRLSDGLRKRFDPKTVLNPGLMG